MQSGAGDSLEDVFRRAEAALFDRAPAAAAVAQLQQDGAAAQPPSGKGRILETLNEVDPIESLMAERVQATRRGRKPGSKNKPKPTISDVGPAGGIGETFVTPETEASENAAAAVHVAPAATAAVLALASVSGDDAGPSAHGSITAAERSGPEAMLPVAGQSPRPRGRIRGRYVTGSEPKPGERWKRRLRGGR